MTPEKSDFPDEGAFLNALFGGSKEGPREEALLVNCFQHELEQVQKELAVE